MSGFRAALVVAFSVLVLAATLPNVFAREGTFGFSLDWDANVVDVASGGAAWHAGIRDGDHIDASANTPAQRVPLDLPDNGPQNPSPGEHTVFRVVRAGHSREVALTAAPMDATALRILTISERVTGLIFVITGTLLLLLRPSRMTWGFYLFALGNNNASALFFTFLPTPLYLTLDTVVGLLPTAAAPVGFLIFALRFPNGTATGWRLMLDRAAPVLFLGNAFLQIYPFWSWAYFGHRSMAEYTAGTALNGGLLAAGFFVVLATYFQTRGVERQRISWLIGGLAVSLMGIVTVTVLNYAPWPYPVTPDIFYVLNLAVPAAVAYCVGRHHILDISFVLNRALVYGAVTLVVVAIFALIDWFFSWTLTSKLGLFADIGAALVIGITLDRLHHRIDLFTENIFFRQRRRAEEALNRVAAALPHASSESTVDTALAQEPSNWLNLASAAVFRRNQGHRYVRCAAKNWPENACGELTNDDQLVLQLEALQTPLRVDEVRWQRTDVPAGAGRPALALPILVRRRLSGFVLYGVHPAGEAIDPDEAKLLEGLMNAASAAYDHIEAETLRRRNRELEGQMQWTLASVPPRLSPEA